MTERVSLIEQYDNRDIVAQIYRIIDIAEHGAIESLNVEKTGAIVRLLFTMHDGTVHPVEFPANGIADITSAQDGNTMNVTITLDDGTERTISWTIVPGVTLDTAQTVTGAKTFSALMTLLAGLGITGTVTIDGDTQITNGHGLSVAGDIDSAGALKGDSAEIRGPVTVAGDITAEGATVSDQAEIAGMAIEPNGTKTVISNDNGIESASPMNLTGSVTMTNIPTTATGQRDTKPVNGTRVQNDLDAYTSMVRTSGNQIIAGYKSFAAGVFSDFIGRPAGEMVTNNYIMITYPRNNGMVSRFEVIDYRTSDFIKLDATMSTYNITNGVVLAVKLGSQTLASGDFMYGYDSENTYVFFKVRSWHNVALRTIITRGNGNTLITPTLSYVVNPDMSSITTTDAVVS